MIKKSTKLKILFLTNNEITKSLLLWLKNRYEVILYDKNLTNKILEKIKPDIIISYNYKYLIKKNIIKKYKIINLHISYLPFNRGAHPNIWSHIENTSKGVTIHYIDEGIDTGDIIVQKKVILYDKKLTNKILEKIKPDIIISYNYKYLIKKNIIKKYKIINLHISYLPFNRGAHPNIWSHIENTPKGVTIHYIDEGIDTGDIIVQKKVILDKNLTLKQSYKKLHIHIQRIFKQNFNKLLKIKPKKQKHKGTFHLAKDLEKVNIPSYDITIKELKELNENR